MVQVVVSDLDDNVVATLKRNAELNGRSLEAEIREVLTRVAQSDRAAFREIAAAFRERLGGPYEPDSTVMIAEDRGR